MLRKLIMFAITSGLAKKLYDNYRQKQQAAEAPFPTARKNPGRKSRATTA